MGRFSGSFSNSRVRFRDYESIEMPSSSAGSPHILNPWVLKLGSGSKTILDRARLFSLGKKGHQRSRKYENMIRRADSEPHLSGLTDLEESSASQSDSSGRIVQARSDSLDDLVSKLDRIVSPLSKDQRSTADDDSGDERMKLSPSEMMLSGFVTLPLQSPFSQEIRSAFSALTPSFDSSLTSSHDRSERTKVMSNRIRTTSDGEDHPDTLSAATPPLTPYSKQDSPSHNGKEDSLKVSPAPPFKAEFPEETISSAITLDKGSPRSNSKSSETSKNTFPRLDVQVSEHGERPERCDDFAAECSEDPDNDEIMYKVINLNRISREDADDFSKETETSVTEDTPSKMSGTWFSDETRSKLSEQGTNDLPSLCAPGLSLDFGLNRACSGKTSDPVTGFCGSQFFSTVNETGEVQRDFFDTYFLEVLWNEITKMPPSDIAKTSFTPIPRPLDEEEFEHKRFDQNCISVGETVSAKKSGRIFEHVKGKFPGLYNELLDRINSNQATTIDISSAVEMDSDEGGSFSEADTSNSKHGTEHEHSVLNESSGQTTPKLAPATGCACFDAGNNFGEYEADELKPLGSAATPERIPPNPGGSLLRSPQDRGTTGRVLLV